MSKKNTGIMKLIEFVGFVLAAVGFCLPLTKGKVWGSNGGSGLNYIKNLFDSGKGNTFLEVMALLVFVFAILGILIMLFKNEKLYEFLCAVAGVACGALFYLKTLGVFETGMAKGLTKMANKIGGAFAQPYVGIYLLIAGFALALIGSLFRKK